MSTVASTPPVATLPTLLIVDDEEGPRHSLRMVFKKDFEVFAVENGDKALEYAKNHAVSLAILDIRMAGKSGIEVLRGLKAIDPHIEIIMLTAYETIETARQALRYGACDYLNKPFDIPTMRAAVSRAVEKHQVSMNFQSSNQILLSLQKEIEDRKMKEEMIRT